MATTWSTVTSGNVILSNGNLTVQGNNASANVFASVGIPANDAGDHTVILTYNAVGFGSSDFGICIGGQSNSIRPAVQYDINGTPVDVPMLIAPTPGRCFDLAWNLLADIAGGVALAAGDIIDLRMKNGFLYYRLKKSGGSYGPYNGSTGLYANATPSTDTGGIPLTAFGGQVVFPYMYIEGDTFTADFTNWTAGSTVGGAGRGTGTGTASSTPVTVSTQSGAGNAPGQGAGKGFSVGGLTLALRNDKLKFHAQSGLGIAYPFLYPTGSDTGVEATSQFDTSPYTVPSNFATHAGSWLTGVAAANGFDHIRLQVHAGPLIEANRLGQTARKTTLLGEISAAVDLILAAGLNCIISLHLTGFVTGYTAAEHLDGSTKFNRYLTMLTDVAQKFASYGPTQVAIELFNEPPATSSFLGTYTTMLASMHATVRAVMPNHTIVATAANLSTPAALAALDPSAFDKNTLWTFHWYPLSSIQGQKV